MWKIFNIENSKFNCRIGGRKWRHFHCPSNASTCETSVRGEISEKKLFHEKIQLWSKVFFIIFSPKGEDGLLAGIKDGKVWIDHSTTDYEQTVDLNEEIVKKGGRMLEAPVTGGLEALKKGQMTVFLAGSYINKWYSKIPYFLPIKCLLLNNHVRWQGYSRWDDAHDGRYLLQCFIHREDGNCSYTQGKPSLSQYINKPRDIVVEGTCHLRTQ